MRKLLLILFVVLSFSAESQNNADLGFMAGASYYMGDINQSQHFYKSQLMLGVIHRYNFNERYAIRTNVLFGKLKASDLDFSNEIQQVRAARFTNEYFDFAVQFEYNFYPFWIPKTERTNRTIPYISSGIGYALNTTASTAYIPFSVGVKHIVYRYYTIGLEWTFCKTFTDELDYLADPMKTGKTSILINNDWQIYAAISVTYRFSVDKACRFFNEK